jgi:hypothetical protein
MLSDLVLHKARSAVLKVYAVLRMLRDYTRLFSVQIEGYRLRRSFSLKGRRERWRIGTR